MYMETRQIGVMPGEADASVLGETIGMALGNLRLRESLEFQWLRDPLTGLFNRRYLEEAWEIESARARREEARSAC